MKFHNAILSLATLSGTTSVVVDAKIWTLRGGLGKTNNNEVHSESLPSVVVAEDLPSPTANLRESFMNDEQQQQQQQWERRLPKKKNKKTKDDTNDGAEATEAESDKNGKAGKKDDDGSGAVADGDTTGSKGGKQKGKKDEKIGAEAILVEAPEDVKAKDGCADEIIEGDEDFRRFLAKGDKDKSASGGGGKGKSKTKGTKATKADLRAGACESFSTDEEPSEEEARDEGLDVPVEAKIDPSCDPDEDVECVDEGVGEDPTIIPPEGAEEELEVNEDEETSRRRLTGDTNQIGDFAPLSCNPVEFDCTGAAGLSSVVGGGPVVVPCGTCLVYDLGAEATIPGLNIIGKLQVPTNYKSTLSTPYVFVQGELEMSDDQPISEDNTSMKIVLTGNTEVMFTPHEAVEGAAPLNAGEKPFLVAGGKLNIRGWDDINGSAGRTWTPILGMDEAARLYPDTIVGETAPRNALPHLTNSSITCPNRIIHDFDDGVDFSVWSGGEGGILSYDETSGTLTETNLERNWQGFRVDFTEFTMDCPITQDATYLVTIRLKIEDPTLEDGAVSVCATENHKDHCPKLGRSLVKAEGAGHIYDAKKYLLPSSIGKNNEWFTFTSEWTWNENELTDIVGQVFYLENFKPGQIIHMDEFQFELPSAKSYPPVDDPCLELVVNGNAENGDGKGWHPYPMWTHRSGSWVPTILEETVDGVANKYWHIGNRYWHGDSLRFHVNEQCFMQGATYSLTVRSRFTGSKTAPTAYWFEIKGSTPAGYRYNKPLYCPSQSVADGWVTCSGTFVVDENYAFTSKPEIIFVTYDESDSTGYVDWDFDDVSIRFENGPAGGLEIDGAAAARWGANSDVHITSSTLHGQDAQDGKVKTVTLKDNGNVVLDLENPIAPILSEAETPGYGVEIAVTTRNIKIVGEDDGTYNGGYLQVFHTPSVAQVIEGVEFYNMGQSSRKNRFAIQLLYNGNVEGTSISSNSIRESNMRCISVDGTANATIASNVGAGVTGHCFYFDRVSAENMVINNLASNMNNRIGWHNRIPGWDDYDADGFSIWSPTNHFIGNVAAGGHKRGFRYYLDWNIYGEDGVYVGGGLRRRAIGTFKDNKAHSNFRQGFHLADFEQFFQFRDPDNVPVFENLSAYRNREQGIYAYNCVYCKFIRGFLSDNQKGIEIRRSDGIALEDFVIQGQTETFKKYVEDNNSHELCGHSSWTYEGIHMMGTMWRLGDKDPGFGLRAKNVVLSGFDKEKEYYDNCPQTEPIGLSTDTHYAAHFDYKTSFENVTVDDSRDIILDGCRSSSYGYPDVVINDIDGSLDPDESASSGALVSDQPYMTGLFGDACKSTGGCMAYCAGVCLGMFTFFTERFGTENYKLRVTDVDSGISVDIPGNARDYGERFNTYAYDGQRTFSASLPAGTYTAEFRDEADNLVWPEYAEEQWAQAADCDGGVSIGDVTLIKPTVDTATECADIIRNGDSVNRTEVTPWLHTKWYGDTVNVLEPGEGKDGGNAIAMDRVHHWTGIAQNLNSMCTDAGEGQFYEFNAWVKMTDADGNPSTVIDPNREWWRNQSPILTMNDRQYRDAATKEYLYTAEHRDLAAIVRPYDSNGWGRVHGIFKMMPESPRLWVELERAPDNVKFLLDSASLTPFSCDREGLVRNGNLETGDSLYWDTWGGDVVLDVVPGPNGGSALKSSSRGWYDRTQAQTLNIECVNAGDRIAFSAKIKNDVDCSIYTWDSNSRCNNLLFYTSKNNLREYHRVGYITADTPDEDGWHHVHGIHVHTENGENPDLSRIYFADANPAWDVYTADVKAYVLEQNCQALVLNPDMEEKDLYWTFTDRDRSKVKVITGAGGSGHALRVYDRDHSWRGLFQVLDSRCFVAGEEYDISAKFRLTDASLAGVTCDPNFQYNHNEGAQCPSIVIYGKKCANGDVYQQFWNAASDKTWNAEGWNDYETSFVVTEELAACGDVKLFIHQVNKNWNIEVDDVQISELVTLSPTLEPTDSPTEFVEEASSSPTVAPTAMPTVSTTTACPPIGEYVELPAGPVMLERSSALCIITKADVDSSGTQTEIAPVARSSNGGDWEKHAGEFAEALLYGKNFGDYDQGCQITLPALASGQKYFIASYIDSGARRLTEVDEERKAVARLMQHGTFGTTLSDLEGWTKGPVTKESAAEWVKEQMNMTMTSHREYFRTRTNPRLTNPVRIGRNNHPCSANARWRKFTFSRKDGEQAGFDQTFEASYDEAVDHVITVKLNGFVRTTVKAIGFEDVTKTFEFNKEYLMCHSPTERVDGWFWLRLDDGSCTHVANPLIQFFPEATQPSYVVNIPNVSGSLQVIDAEHSDGEELINTVALDDELCDTLSDITEQLDAPVHGMLDDGSFVLFDPRLMLQENTVANPEPDGGGLIKSMTGDVTKCANVPRTFLNEDSCVLSNSATACSSSTAPDLLIDLNAENLGLLHDLTGQYVYGILGLPVVDKLGEQLESPCTPGLRSRWEIKSAGECTATVLGTNTHASLVELLSESSDSNAFIRDINFPASGFACDISDDATAEVEIIIENHCFKRVHPEHMSVFDFTYWTLDHTHPGNMIAMMEGDSNPIKKFRDEEGSAFLIFPSYPSTDSDVPPHPLERWVTHGEKFAKLGRFGDTALFVDLPNEMRTDEVAAHFGDSTGSTGSFVVTCGSPGEVANDPTLGKYFIPVHEKGTDWGLREQKGDVFFNVVLNAQDQLRQRVAFALSQVLVVVDTATAIVGDHTEAYVSYHDILVRNAFGNYRDILKQVSYNPLMAENLSFIQSKSTAHMWEHQQKHAFADENFAREIMQLFSTGLYMLNKDGSHKIDENGEWINAYTNDEIMSFARLWTGFDYQEGRGNMEENTWFGNRIDPMRIEASWRDKFPKTDMTGGYIGDGYPLCVDLPDKMWLRKGATYRLLGSKHTPELMEDDPAYKNDLTMKHFVLEAGSNLKEALCNADANGNCQYAMSVTLESNLSCTGKECEADTARVVDTGEGIYYEYTSPTCVEQAFYSNAKKIIFKDRMKDSSCANPLLAYASEACCSTGDVAAYRNPEYVYDQERVLFATAGDRCVAMGKKLCDFNYINDLDHHKKGYHWTSDSCKIQVKVDSAGQTAIVYKPNSYNHLHPHIDPNNRNYFKVHWDGEYPINNDDSPDGNDCGNGACTALQTGGCLCDTSVFESRVFSRMPSSVDEVLSKLTIGAYDTLAYDDGTYSESVTENDVTAYFKAGEGFTVDTVFEVTDKNRRLFRFKNSSEKVRVNGDSSLSFRNPPSFMSVLNPESTAGKAAAETDAALDHYFYHDNTAPFLALRMIQRMVTSNPSPRYIQAVADAFTSGEYMGIGSGDYGDMAAMVAAVILEPQARDETLDNDPFDGQFVEQLLQITRLSRGLELTPGDTVKLIYFDRLKDRIGQAPYEYDTVFSFFLPEYQPDGTTKVGQATLVAPEAVALDAPKTVELMNGMFSMVKFGLNRCYGGFNQWHGSCYEDDDFSNSYAHLTHEMAWDTPEAGVIHADAVISELSLILTAGRLSPTNFDIIKSAYLEKLPTAGHAAAHRMAVQLILTTPEFHTTQTTISSGLDRPEPAVPVSSGVPYKAIVMVMLSGGADSFNMLVPHTCTGAKDMYQEYNEVRLDVALPKEDLIELNNVANQVCEKFGVHPQYENVASMFNSGDLSWFTNTGVLDKETDKHNFWKDTVTQLFAHNWMQLAAQKVDPFKDAFGTGVLGRIRDAATKQGRSIGGFAIDWSAAATSGMPGVNPSALILSRNGVTQFNERPSSDDMMYTIKLLNSDVTPESGAFSDLWADHITTALANNKRLYDTLSVKTTATSFPNEHLSRQLEMVAKMIDSREERGSDGDVFYASKGGFDTHTNTLVHTDSLFGSLDAAYGAFRQEMEAKGIWDQVTLITVSDFARTLNPNGNAGVDHAWGGNYVMMGGAVKGGQIHGTYPDNLTDDGERMLGRGRAIPTTGWEVVFKAVAEWFGCAAEDMPDILPNMGSFPRADYWIPAADVFNI